MVTAPAGRPSVPEEPPSTVGMMSFAPPRLGPPPSLALEPWSKRCPLPAPMPLPSRPDNRTALPNRYKLLRVPRLSAVVRMDANHSFALVMIPILLIVWIIGNLAGALHVRA
jgi:hypothetical protein